MIDSKNFFERGDALISHWSQRFLLILVVFAFVACRGVGYKAAESDPQSRAANQVSESVEGNWQAKCNKPDPKATEYENEKKLFDCLTDVITRGSDEQFSGVLERIRGSSLSYSQFSVFEKILLQAFIVRLADTGDKERLSSLLAAKCPALVVGRPIEVIGLTTE